MNKEEFEKVLDNGEITELLWKANKKIKNDLGIKDADIFEILDEGIRSICRNRFNIVKANIGEKKVNGIAIEYRLSDGEMVEIDSAYTVKDGMVSVDAVYRIMEMAYMGYELVQSKEIKCKDVF